MRINVLNKIGKIIIDSSESLLSALKQMDNQGVKLLFVFKNEKYQSIVSSGDIQRAILGNYDLNTPIKTILRSKIKVAKEEESFEEIKQRMIDFRIECMPVLNNNNEIVEVYFWEDVFPPEQKRTNQKLDIPVIIMAGGKGARLKPLTNVLPKPLIPIGEKTIVEDIMCRFNEVGCNRFLLSINYKSELIEYYFNKIVEGDYDISFFKEDKPLGTAGSLYLLKDKINTTFFVSNCDIIIDADYAAFYNYHVEHKNELTIVSALKSYAIPYGTIVTGDNGKLVELKEKPELTFQINTGMYILEPHLLDEIPQNKFFHITDLIENIRNRKGRIGVFPISDGSWKDIGEKQLYKTYFNL